MVKSAAFVRWFSGSVLASAGGEPLVLYHATAGDFTVFDPNRLDEIGVHVGTAKQAAYIADGRAQRGQACILMPLYVRLRRPLRLEDRGDFGARNVVEQLAEQHIYPPDGSGLHSPATYASMGRAGLEAVQRVIQGNGFDGIEYLNRREGFDPFGPDGVDGDTLNDMTDDEVLEIFPEAQCSYIVFDSSQLKSVFNRGSYDPLDQDILR